MGRTDTTGLLYLWLLRDSCVGFMVEPGATSVDSADRPAVGLAVAVLYYSVFLPFIVVTGLCHAPYVTRLLYIAVILDRAGLLMMWPTGSDRHSETIPNVA